MVAFLDRIVGKIKKTDKVETDGKEVLSVYTKDRLVGNLFEIGDFTYGNPRVVHWDDSTKLHIGKFCSIADGVTILLGGNHRTDWVTTYPFNELSEPFPKASSIQGHPSSKGDVWIGNDVWIGYGATVLSGVHIGDGAVIGANTVVTKDVDPYTIVVGNPGKMVKKRFDDAIVDALLEIRWWDWEIEKINEEVGSLCNSDVFLFIKNHNK